MTHREISNKISIYGNYPGDYPKGEHLLMTFPPGVGVIDMYCQRLIEQGFTITNIVDSQGQQVEMTSDKTI